SSDDGCISESFFNSYELILVIIVSLIFSFHRSITSRLANWAKSFIKPKTSPEVLRLSSEVKRLRGELAAISPTSEFSAYFKTERLLNKTVEQYDLAVAENTKNQSSPVKLEGAVQIVSQAVGLLLLHTVSGIYALCIPSTALWPLNVILRFPSVWSSDVCGSAESSLSPVSMFVFMYCVIAAARVIFSK
ncbi:hypothetical protein V3C99_014047, partial [Haemonchus contortus]